jgi:imidazolonepropionase-like amidohydrolase
MKRMIKALTKKAFFVLFCLGLGLNLSAQRSPQSYNDAPKEVTKTFYIKNAYVVTEPGQTTGITNVLIENGLISQIGPAISIPSDAKIINADSMYVYAGFIDALSHTGIPVTEESSNNRRSGGQRGGSRPSVSDPGNPGNKTAGITPEVNVKDLISAKDKSIENMRKAGFTISHVVPNGKMMPGSGAIILLNGNHIDQMLLKEDVSLFSQFTSSGRMYPSTVIGIMAKWRDLYRQATYAKMHEANYAKFPVGMERPQYDRATRALYPVIDNKKSVYFRTPKVLDIHRALQLQNDLSFDIVLSEVKQGWHVTDKIKSKNVSVLLSHDIPKDEEKKEEKKKDKTGKEDAPESDNPRLAKMKERLANAGDEMPAEMRQKMEDRIKSMEENKSSSEEESDEEDKEKEKEDDPETKALKERKAKSIKDYQSQAAEFEKKGITFSFSNINGKAKDLKSHLKTMIDNGLSETAALASITTNPAKMLGISEVAGTVTPGKLANLVVCDKSYFEEKSEIKYVFVEGQIFDYKKPKKKKKKGSGEAPAKDLAGKWNYELQVPGDTPRGTIIIKNSGGDFTATITNDDEPDDAEEVDNLEVDGQNVYFQFTVDNNGFEMVLDFDLTFDEETFEGSVSVGEFGTFPISGAKITPEN